jgi:amino acid transporter
MQNAIRRKVPAGKATKIDSPSKVAPLLWLSLVAMLSYLGRLIWSLRLSEGKRTAILLRFFFGQIGRSLPGCDSIHENEQPLFSYMVVFGIAAALLLTGMLSMLFSRNADGWLKIVSYVVLALILVLGTFYLSFAAYNLVADWNGEISKDIRAYSVLTLGLPLAALGSLALVIVLPATSSEKLKFEGLSFKLEGPAVQIVLWVVFFRDRRRT